MIWVEFTTLLFIIIFAAYLLSRGGEVLAAKWGFNIVGSIVLALLTTLPEYAFVYWACVKTHYTMAIGSAIGACTILVTLGYGLVILLATSRMSRHPVEKIRLSKATRIDAIYLLITAVVAFVLIYMDNTLSLVDGIILTVIFFIYIFHVFKGEKNLLGHEVVTRKALIRAFVELLIGGAIVFITSERFVDSMIHVASSLNVPPVLIAVVLGPIASEMPEKLTAYIVVLKNGANAELSICNFIGSKVNHNSLLLAVIPFVAVAYNHGPVHNMKSPMFMAMTILTVFVGIFLMRGVLERWQGWVLTVAYVGAMVLAVMTTSPGSLGH